MHALELDPLCPIAEMARIHSGPKFSEPEAEPAILDLADRIGADLVIPNMDSATVVLANLATTLSQSGHHAVVSSPELCAAMQDKIAAEKWFAAHCDPRPMQTDRAPAIAKHRYGYASKGIFVLKSAVELAAFRARPDAGDYLIQKFVEGPEYTVDAFVAKDGSIVDILSRRRLVVEAGVVLNSRTEWHGEIVNATERILSRPGWRGPVTLQYIVGADGEARIIEINPRFGGGVTHSIHCGLHMPKWIIKEWLGESISHEPYRWQRGNLMTRARVDIFHDNRS